MATSIPTIAILVWGLTVRETIPSRYVHVNALTATRLELAGSMTLKFLVTSIQASPVKLVCLSRDRMI